MRKENKVPVIPRLWAYAKPNGIFLFLGLVCAIISIALSLWMPILIGHGVEAGSGGFFRRYALCDHSRG